MTRVAITGADGFLGWHLQVLLRARGIGPVVAIGRGGLADPAGLARQLRGADALVHLAGVNRGDPEAVESGNPALAQRVLEGLDLAEAAPVIVFANSVMTGTDTPYGRGKRRAAECLAAWCDGRGTALVDVVLPNLFGEGGRPDYNSFVATFCHRLASGGVPRVEVDRPVELLHAQVAAGVIADHLAGPAASCTVRPSGRLHRVSEILARLQELAAVYDTGRVPDLSEPFAVELFNTYRSYLYPQMFPRALVAKADDRGAFVETVQSLGGQGQASFSTTRPGATRGEHFHLRKVERFAVVSGQARIAVRPVAREGMITFDLDGDQPAFVDMPTLHTHNITNTGDRQLLTMFWTNEVYNPADPDTYPEPVA